MSLSNVNLGKTGENLAVNFLKNDSYVVLEKNFHCHWGEIDIICRKENKITFVEVKTRVGIKYGKPYEAITFYKLRGLKRAINHYLLKNSFKNFKLSLAVVSIILKPNLELSKLDFYDNISI